MQFYEILVFSYIIIDQFQTASLHDYAEQSVDDFEGSYEIETVTMHEDDTDLFTENNASMQSVPTSTLTSQY